MYKAENKD